MNPTIIAQTIGGETLYTSYSTMITALTALKDAGDVYASGKLVNASDSTLLIGEWRWDAALGVFNPIGDILWSNVTAQPFGEVASVDGGGAYTLVTATNTLTSGTGTAWDKSATASLAEGSTYTVAGDVVTFSADPGLGVGDFIVGNSACEFGNLLDAGIYKPRVGCEMYFTGSGLFVFGGVATIDVLSTGAETSAALIGHSANVVISGAPSGSKATVSCGWYSTDECITGGIRHTGAIYCPSHNWADNFTDYTGTGSTGFDANWQNPSRVALNYTGGGSAAVAGSSSANAYGVLLPAAPQTAGFSAAQASMGANGPVTGLAFRASDISGTLSGAVFSSSETHVKAYP